LTLSWFGHHFELVVPMSWAVVEPALNGQALVVSVIGFPFGFDV
jgi:hypothetical protein